VSCCDWSLATLHHSRPLSRPHPFSQPAVPQVVFLEGWAGFASTTWHYRLTRNQSR